MSVGVRRSSSLVSWILYVSCTESPITLIREIAMAKSLDHLELLHPVYNLLSHIHIVLYKWYLSIDRYNLVQCSPHYNQTMFSLFCETRDPRETGNIQVFVFRTQKPLNVFF